MAEAPPIASALIVTETDAATARLGRLVSIMTEAGVAISRVESAEEAAAQILVSDPSEPRLVFLDGTDPSENTPADPLM